VERRIEYLDGINERNVLDTVCWTMSVGHCWTLSVGHCLLDTVCCRNLCLPWFPVMLDVMFGCIATYARE
jgi:hypothetical protein